MSIDLDDLHERLMRLVDRETMDMCESVFAELKTLRHEKDHSMIRVIDAENDYIVMFDGKPFGLPLSEQEMKILRRLVAVVVEELLHLARRWSYALDNEG